MKFRKAVVGIFAVFCMSAAFPIAANAGCHINLGPIISVLKQILSWVEQVENAVQQVENTLYNLPNIVNSYLKQLEKQTTTKVQRTEDRYRGLVRETVRRYGSYTSYPSPEDVVPVFYNPATGRWETPDGNPPTYKQVATYIQMLTGGAEPPELKQLAERAGKKGILAYQTLKVRRSALEAAVASSMKDEEIAKRYAEETDEVMKKIADGTPTGKLLQFQAELIAINNKLLAQQNRLLANISRELSILAGQEIKSQEETTKKMLRAYNALGKSK